MKVFRIICFKKGSKIMKISLLPFLNLEKTISIRIN